MAYPKQFSILVTWCEYSVGMEDQSTKDSPMNIMSHLNIISSQIWETIDLKIWTFYEKG